MQSNRTLVLVLLVALSIAGFFGWQAFASPEPLAPPVDVTKKVEAAAGTLPDPAETKAAEAAASSGDGAGDRTEVAGEDPSVSGLPSIVGQVVADNGQPVVGAQIVCRPGTGFGASFADLGGIDFESFQPDTISRRVRERLRNQVTVASDEQGRFRMRLEGVGDKVTVRVLMRGFQVLEHVAARPVEEDTDVGVLELAAGAIITGRVVDAVGNAVVGAQVSRMSPTMRMLASWNDSKLPGQELLGDLQQGASSVTDAQGRFELAHVAPGEFDLRARHQDYPTANRSGLTASKGRVLADILVTMPQVGVIRGIVQGLPSDTEGVVVMAAKKQEAKDGAEGLAALLGDASDLFGEMGMSFGERESEIAADGSFVLKGLRASNTYRVWLAQKGKGFAVAGVCSKPQEVPTGATAVVLQYEPGATVTFVVVDDKTGKPVERLWVRQQLVGGGGINGLFMPLGGRMARQEHYPDGQVTLAHLRPKDKQKLGLSIDAHGYAGFDHADVELLKAGVVDLGTIRLESAPVLQVTVLGKGQRPVAGARVALKKAGDRAGIIPVSGTGPSSGRTDAAGRCTINLIEGTPCELSVRRKGYAPLMRSVAAQGPAVREQQVQLLVGGSVAVTVRTPDGELAKGVKVEHRVAGRSNERRVTSERGVAQFEHLAPGVHEFRLAQTRDLMVQLAGRSERDETWLEVEVQDEQEASLALEKAISASLTGIVRQNGVALEGASVQFVKGPKNGGDEDPTTRLLRSLGGARNRKAKTDEAGEYELFDLSSGQHQLRVTHKSRAMAATVELRLFDGDNRCDIELTTSSLFGVVRDAQGKPVAGAEISAAVQAKAATGPGGEIGNLMAGMMGRRGGSGGAQRSDQNGEFTLSGVQADVPLTIVAKKAGLVPAKGTVTVPLGQRQGPVELQLMPAGQIKVTVENAQAFATVRAKFVGQGEAAPVVQMLRKGKVTLDSLRPGPWEVTYLAMSARGKGAPKQTVEVVAGETQTVSF